MTILSRLFKILVPSVQHFGIHQCLNGHLVDSGVSGKG